MPLGWCLSKKSKVQSFLSNRHQKQTKQQKQQNTEKTLARHFEKINGARHIFTGTDKRQNKRETEKETETENENKNETFAKNF